jgi:hypothetical protein
MPLIPKILLSALSPNASSLYIQNVTGVYSTINLGGYGVPNVLKTDIQAILIKLYHEGAETTALTLNYRPINVQDFVNGTSQLIKVTDFNVQGTLIDGVIHALYYDLLIPAAITSVATNLLSISSVAKFRSNETVVVANNIAYRVDTAAANTPSILYLLDPIPANTTSVEPGYVATAHILNLKHVESDMAKVIGSFAGRCGCTDKEVMDISKKLLKLLGAPVRYECGDLKGANLIITGLANDLKKGGCGC